MPNVRTIAVLNQKGGVGKSMVAQNLAAVAHLQGKKTLLLDLDRQGTSTDWYARRSPTSKLRGLVVHKADRVWNVAQFAEMTDGFDFVVCDGPARLSEVSAAAAVFADIALMPLRVGWGEWWAAEENEQMLDKADDVRAVLGKSRVRRVYLLNEVRPRVAETQRMIEALEAVELLPVRLHQRCIYDRARGEGEATLTLEPTGQGAREVKALFDCVINLGGMAA